MGHMDFRSSSFNLFKQFSAMAWGKHQVIIVWQVIICHRTSRKNGLTLQRLLLFQGGTLAEPWGLWGHLLSPIYPYISYIVFTWFHMFSHKIVRFTKLHCDTFDGHAQSPESFLRCLSLHGHSAWSQGPGLHWHIFHFLKFHPDLMYSTR